MYQQEISSSEPVSEKLPKIHTNGHNLTENFAEEGLIILLEYKRSLTPNINPVSFSKKLFLLGSLKSHII